MRLGQSDRAHCGHFNDVARCLLLGAFACEFCVLLWFGFGFGFWFWAACDTDFGCLVYFGSVLGGEGGGHVEFGFVLAGVGVGG
jgi:hypothetical protein